MNVCPAVNFILFYYIGIYCSFVGLYVILTSKPMVILSTGLAAVYVTTVTVSLTSFHERLLSTALHTVLSAVVRIPLPNCSLHVFTVKPVDTHKVCHGDGIRANDG